MPRPIRIEYAGARYHVINRGNYRQDLFAVHGSGEAFERTLFECCERFGWRLHAYVLMSNHYHLCIETPEPNLQKGMQWLQSVFANRFNKYIHTPGHVFQGRYKALLISGQNSLLRVVNYIHLNPVRAGLMKVEQLKEYKLASYPRQFSKEVNPACLTQVWLNELGIKPGPAGMRTYARHLGICEENDPGRLEAMRKEFMSGWFIGDEKAKQKLLKKERKMDPEIRASKALSHAQDYSQGIDKAEALFKTLLKKADRTEQDLKDSRKLALWKVAIAAEIKQQTAVTNRWLCERLHMGSIPGVSQAITRWRSEPGNRIE